MMDGYLRIGEFSERVGVSPDLLRAWERRYGLLQPDRSSGGFRLYSDGDVASVERILALLDQGLSASEAARLAIEAADRPEPVTTPAPDTRPLERSIVALDTALAAFDDEGSQRALDDLLALYSVETVLQEVIVPTLARIGRRWATGEITVAQEHFASNVLRGRLLGMARGWGRGSGAQALLAAPPGEEHDLSLVVFGLALWRQGWRITFLGADTPVASLLDVVERVRPRLVVLAAVEEARFRAVADELHGLGLVSSLAIGGAGASGLLADELGAFHLDTDPVTAAARVTATTRSRATGAAPLRPADPTS